MINYSPFFKMLKQKRLSQYDAEYMGVGNRLMDSLRNNKGITTRSINKLCLIFNCTPNDILKVVPTSKELKDISANKRISYRKDLHKRPLKSDNKSFD